MTIHRILKMGDPRLLRSAQRVTEFDTDALHLLISDMLETMADANGAGLAAPQIGIDLQLVIFGTNAPNPRYPDAPIVPRTVLINPTLVGVFIEEFAIDTIAQSALAVQHGVPRESGWEGCLSVPGLRGVVPRFAQIRYTGFDQFGDPINRLADGFHARVVQHECDHLRGVLYPMRIEDFTQFGYTDILFPGLDAEQDD